MAKSKIIKELANKEISLEVDFNRLLIIASDIGNTDLIDWATNELNGYSNDSKIPKYREGKMGHIVYSGINGRLQVNNQPLPLSVFDKEILDYIKVNYFDQDIATIERFAFGDNGEIGLELTELAGNVYKNSSIQCISISMKFPKEMFLGILSAIRTKLLKIFIELDRDFGCLDNLDIDTNGRKLEDINNKLNVIIYEDNSVTIGDSNKLKNNLFQKLGGKK